MSYASTTIADVLDQINRTYFLPAIQRPYVWEASQVVALFDSLLKGYPISSFLFWELQPENRGNWDIYQFVENFRYGQVHNEPAETDGRDVVLVLDGQQRLTSLLIGLRGSYTVKLKHKRWDNPLAWSKQRLYLNLLKDPGQDETGEEDEVGVTYGLRFFEEPPGNDRGHLWFKVGRILDCRDDDRFDQVKEEVVDSLPDTVTRGEVRIVERNLDRLYRTVWKDDVVAYYTEKSQSYDRVLDIFIRANDGGTKLSKSDLLLSMITSKWDGVNAREEIFNFVDRLNDELDRKNDLNKDFVMRACLVLSDLDHVYKVNNFTTANLAVIQRNWPEIKRSLEATLRLVNRFGIDRDTLTSANAVLPIAYYLFKLGDGVMLDGTTPFEVQNRLRIRRWLLGALLNSVFGGSSDQTIGTSRALLREAMETERDFPFHALTDGLRKRRGRVVAFDEEANVAALLETTYGQRTCFLALSTLYEEQNWSSSLYHIDHIIPRTLCTRRSLQGRGISESRIDEILACVDRIGNLQLLLGRENSEKAGMSFGDWIRTRDGGFLEMHLIPPEPHLWVPEALPEFVAAREDLIRKRLRLYSIFGDSGPVPVWASQGDSPFPIQPAAG
ncbi:DUF262 domain-containing protein [Azospirillum sp. Sh1]|uniref:GmrSD restriction endonuclease domain-containing protein n=1 Tax=Azospirillum sp. Sh1 TaxID=2607285 RepID=UPI0011F01076|nr:DUF262 domain-containing protein [Azospirillum sp. Sh1]KAA0570338.1 DUF262 domain-containing protein [Azospirillum sp. Sh1]